MFAYCMSQNERNQSVYMREKVVLQATSRMKKEVGSRTMIPLSINFRIV